MRFSAALVAGFAAASSAFLVPAEVANDAIKDTRYREGHRHHKDPITALISESLRVVDLQCPGCPYAFAYTEDTETSDGTTQRGIGWISDVENKLHLEFTVKEDVFYVNGQPVFPFEAALQEGSHTVIKATQSRTDTMERSVEFPINFALEAPPPFKPAKHQDENFELVPIRFTVLGLNGLPVKVDTIDIKLLRNKETGDYSIVRVEHIPFAETPGAESCEGARRWSLCRIKAMIVAQLRTMMDGAKERAHKMKGWVVSGKKHGGCKGRKHPHGGEFRKHDGHGPHKHHRHHHRIGRVLRQVLRFFVIPALLGIIGGLTASALGMLVGQTIVYLWRRVHHGNQRGPLRLVEQEIIIVDDEKDGLLSSETQTEEQLPQYHDVEAEAVEEEKK